MDAAEFRQCGHALIETIAGLLETLPERPIVRNSSPKELRGLLGGDGLPEHGAPAGELLAEAARLLFDNSLYNGHPRFMGYVTSPPSPIGMLADLLAAAVNPNVGGWALSPMATEIEAQTVRWIAELIGYPTECGGLLVSGGNQANFIGFLAARLARAGWDVQATGTAGVGSRQLRAYTSADTHTWIQKAADMFGLGTDSIRWIPTDDKQRMDVDALVRAVAADRDAGDVPFLAVGTAGTVGTGAVDPLLRIATIAQEHNLWFHVDGAYGGFAAALPSAGEDLRALALADSVAVDPHKWLYSPLEAGCALVRDRESLRHAFSYTPPYYHFDPSIESDLPQDKPINYYEYGPQNSRGFRALKIWLGLRQIGREGNVQQISDDIALAAELYRLADAHPDLEALTHNLSITTFRYAPPELRGGEKAEQLLNALNTSLLERMQAGGEAFVSNAVLDGRFALRACIVNFRTSLSDVEAVIEITVRLGNKLEAELQSG